MVCIYDFNGNQIKGTEIISRKKCREMFAKDAGTKWSHLWDIGYRCKLIKAK